VILRQLILGRAPGVAPCVPGVSGGSQGDGRRLVPDSDEGTAPPPPPPVPAMLGRPYFRSNSSARSRYCLARLIWPFCRSIPANELRYSSASGP